MKTPLAGDSPPTTSHPGSSPGAEGRLRELMRRRVSLRQLLRLAAAAGLAGAGRTILGPERVEATYTPGTPSDTVNTNLTVQGNLIVRRTDGTGNLGIGTTTPQGKLDVAGEIRNNTLVLVDSNGRGKQCFFGAGPVYTPPPATSTGTWGRVKTTTWQAAGTMSWSSLQSMNGTWDRVSAYSWNDLLSKSWYEVTVL